MKVIKLIWFGLALALVPPLNATAPAADSGKKLYDAKCASCHGKDGKGSPSMAKALKVDPALLDMTAAGTARKSDEELLRITEQGKNKMPGYAKKMKPADMKGVLRHLRALAPKEGKTAEPPKEGEAK